MNRRSSVYLHAELLSLLITVKGLCLRERQNIDRDTRRRTKDHRLHRFHCLVALQGQVAAYPSSRERANPNLLLLRLRDAHPPPRRRTPRPRP